MDRRSESLRILNLTFKIIGPLFLAISLTFEVDDNGKLWIMWRDDPLLAATCCLLAVFAFVGWWRTSALLQARGKEGIRRPRIPSEQAYNIWRVMDPALRRRLAFAVFLMFATVGPLSLLMSTAFQPVRPLNIFIVTFCSGGMSASIVLFARKPLLLILAVAVFLAGNIFSPEITGALEGRPVPSVPATAGVLTLTEVQQSDIRAQRALVGFIGAGLLACGYVMFLRLLIVEGRQRTRLASEVAIAQRIQESLLPSAGFSNVSYEISGRTQPATEVGGDYYDMIEAGSGAIVVVIADVTGHGVGAGTLAAMTKSALYAQIGHNPSPIPALENLNTTMRAVAERNMFVTMAYVLLQADGRAVTISTAGHPPVLYCGSGGLPVREIRTASLALGMARDSRFASVEQRAAPGDMYLLYTDGVVEAISPGGEQFGMERLSATLRKSSGLSAADCSAAVMAELTRFTGGNALRDDATVVCIRVR